MKNIIVLITISLLSASCFVDYDAYDPVPTANPNPGDGTGTGTGTSTGALPVKFTMDGEASAITYDGNKIVSMKSPDNSSIISFTYTGDLISKISFVQGPFKNEVTYTYGNGMLTEANEILNLGTSDEIKTSFMFSAPISNTIKGIKKVTEGLNTYTLNMTYTLENNRVVNYIGTGTGTLEGKPTEYTEKGTFQYDTKNGIFKNVKGFDKLINSGWFFDSEFLNSVSNFTTYKIHLKTVNSNIDADTYTYFKNTYDYNTENYPTKRTRQYYELDESLDGEKEFTTIEYK